MKYTIELLDTSDSKIGTWKEVVSKNGTLDDMEKTLDSLRQSGGYYRVIIT